MQSIFQLLFVTPEKKGLKDCPEGGGDSRNAPLLRITAKKKPFRGWQKILTLPIFWGTKYLQMDPIHLLNWHKYQARKLFSRPKWGCFLAYNFRQVPPLQSVAKYTLFFLLPSLNFLASRSRRSSVSNFLEKSFLVLSIKGKMKWQHFKKLKQERMSHTL